MKVTVAVGLVVLLAGQASAGQDPVGTARDLYGSAAYEEALLALARLSNGAPPEVARQASQYRAYCLFALGRTAEAEQVAEALIRERPLAIASGGDASPRIEEMFARVRRRVLPILMREEYAAARASLERHDPKGAEPHLLLVRQMIAERRADGADDDTMSDLALLVDGFLDLSRGMAEQPVVRAVPVPLVAIPSVGPETAARRRLDEPRAPISGLGPTAIYAGEADRHLLKPVAISQAVPRLSPSVAEAMKSASRKSLVLELTISERGNVQDVTVAEGAQPEYDRLVSKSAWLWRYRPATIDGVPVRFRQAVTVAFQSP